MPSQCWLCLGTACLLLAAACAGSPPASFTGVDPESGMHIRLRREPVVADRELGGSYVSPQLGRLRLTHHGSQVEGRYTRVRGACRVSGWLRGELHQNLLRFDFRERLSGCSHAGRYTGGGHLLFDVPAAPDARVRLFGRRHYLVRRVRVQVGEQVLRRDAGVVGAVQQASGQASREANEEQAH